MSFPHATVIAGTVSTILFIGSYLPMLHKAVRTRDLGSYSRGSLVLSNVGNAAQTVYVLSLPPGPIWVLQAFYNVVTAAMFWLHHRHGRPGAAAAAPDLVSAGAGR